MYFSNSFLGPTQDKIDSYFHEIHCSLCKSVNCFEDNQFYVLSWLWTLSQILRSLRDISTWWLFPTTWKIIAGNKIWRLICKDVCLQCFVLHRMSTWKGYFLRGEKEFETFIIQLKPLILFPYLLKCFAQNNR